MEMLKRSVKFGRDFPDFGFPKFRDLYLRAPEDFYHKSFFKPQVN